MTLPIKNKIAAQNIKIVCKIMVTPGQLYSGGYSTVVIQMAIPTHTIDTVIHIKSHTLMEDSLMREIDTMLMAMSATMLRKAGAM